MKNKMPSQAKKGDTHAPNTPGLPTTPTAARRTVYLRDVAAVTIPGIDLVLADISACLLPVNLKK